MSDDQMRPKPSALPWTTKQDAEYNPSKNHQNVTQEQVVVSLSVAHDTVEYLFSIAPDRMFISRQNPVTGEHFVQGEDSIRPHKARAVRALMAEVWFAAQKPSDADHLPLNYIEREKTKWKGDGISYLVGAFACSIHCWDFRTAGHPDFETFARGVMASDSAPDFVRNDPQLRRRYPPKPLVGLNWGLVYEPE